MAYATPVTRRNGDKLIIEVDLSATGEISHSGRAENLVDPRQWHDFEDQHGFVGIKMTVCRPLASKGRRQR